MEGNPEITYALVRFHGVEGKNIVGEMFDPYFYMTDDPYNHWEDNRKSILRWLKQYNIKTIATYVQSERYAKLANREPNIVNSPVSIPNTNIIMYKVDSDALNKEDL